MVAESFNGWLSHGGDPEQFWRLTPWQTGRVVHYRKADDRYTTHSLITGAWMTVRLMRSPSLPDLQSLLDDVEAPPMTAAEMWAMLPGTGKKVH